MQTQIVSLNVSAVQIRTTGKVSKAAEKTFDSFMTKSDSKANGKEISPSADGKSDSTVQNEVSAPKDGFDKNKISLKSDKTEMKELDAEEINEIGNEIVEFLKNTFGMSEEDIVDMLEQIGISPMDLALQMSPDMEEVTVINIVSIKAFVMEVHGVEDESLFLTSDQLSQELTDVMKGIQDILSDKLGVDLSHFSGEDTAKLQSFVDRFAEMMKQAGMPVQENVIVKDEDDSVMEVMASENKEEIPVVVEMSEESAMSDTGRNTGSEQPKEMASNQMESPVNAFVERLTQSVDNTRTAEMLAETRTTMSNIVEQVVNHIRIRVLPQTTSMELQLNPESLGRVNLNVSSNNGVATATLTVQNQVAKEALESQITVLRENLESQGLKVESVEVNVSNFGFKHPEDSNNGQYKQGKKNSSKRVRLDGANAPEEEISEEKAADGQTGENVVDYTA